MILYQNICCSIRLCNVTKSSKVAVVDPRWVQPTIATRCSMYRLFCSGQHGVHQSTIASIHSIIDMSIVYSKLEVAKRLGDPPPISSHLI